MLRRTLILAALVVMLGVSFGLAADVKTKTWNITHNARADTAGTTAIGVAGYRSFRVFIDEVLGDTLTVDSLIWIIQTKVDNENANDHDWISAYTRAVVTADSADYPIEFAFKGDVDSLVWDQIRIKQNACISCDSLWEAGNDSGFATYLVTVMATRR